MNFVLLDDIAEHHVILATHLRRICEENSWPCRVALEATTLREVLDYAATCREPTVYFLDIELEKQQTSLKLHEVIEANGCESYIVYVSAHPHYAMECLHTHAFDFLLKPWTVQQLTQCVEAIMRAYQRPRQGALLQVNTGSRIIFVPQEEIVCFTRRRMNTLLHRTDGSVLEWRESFDHLLPRLEKGRFLQCHRACILQLTHVRTWDLGEGVVTLSNGMTSPVSRRRAAALRDALDAKEVRTHD
ncbi:MAG: LytTR family transcriptional regulator DNA-binding domain-containing protein [Clostridia bacterium]|nr:LytTR family transcriptional regulator DNA-binding domain-containing protein [Clostridia bacterium]